MRRQGVQCQLTKLYSTRVIPGIRMPIRPLDSVAPAMAAQHSHISQRRCLGAVESSCARIKPQSDKVRKKVAPISSVKKWLLATIHAEPATINAARWPICAPQSFLALNQTTITVKKPVNPGQKR